MQTSVNIRKEAVVTFIAAVAQLFKSHLGRKYLDLSYSAVQSFFWVLKLKFGTKVSYRAVLSQNYSGFFSSCLEGSCLSV